MSDSGCRTPTSVRRVNSARFRFQTNEPGARSPGLVFFRRTLKCQTIDLVGTLRFASPQAGDRHHHSHGFPLSRFPELIAFPLVADDNTAAPEGSSLWRGPPRETRIRSYLNDSPHVIHIREGDAQFTLAVTLRLCYASFSCKDPLHAPHPATTSALRRQEPSSYDGCSQAPCGPEHPQVAWIKCAGPA
jgi:hypothetical protein